jgi:hypothetical protein
MIRTSRAVWTLAVISLLVAGCTSTDPSPATRDNPAAPSDRMAAAACTKAIGATEERAAGDLHTIIFGNVAASQRAILSEDPALREVGERLVPIGKQALDLFVVQEATAAELAPNLRRLEDARLSIIAACTDLFGPQPWEFAALPSPDASH